MARRPTVVAFDVVGTLFSLEPVRERLQEAGLPGEALELWFSRFLRDAFALDAAGVYQPFRTVAQGTLETLVAQRGIEPRSETIQRVLQAFSELPPHPDAAPAFEALRRAGTRVVTLTNGSAETTRNLLHRAGLEGFVEQTISIDDVRHWKPRREVYLHAARIAGVEPATLALVAAHAWDVQGARQAGLTTGWVGRLERRFQPAMGSPDVSGDTLVEVANGLLALPQ